MRRAGHLLWHAVDPGVVLELLLARNRMRCRPPLDDAEVAQVVVSIVRLHVDENRGAEPGDLESQRSQILATFAGLSSRGTRTAIDRHTARQVYTGSIIARAEQPRFPTPPR